MSVTTKLLSSFSYMQKGMLLFSNTTSELCPVQARGHISGQWNEICISRIRIVDPCTVYPRSQGKGGSDSSIKNHRNNQITARVATFPKKNEIAPYIYFWTKVSPVPLNFRRDAFIPIFKWDAFIPIFELGQPKIVVPLLWLQLMRSLVWCKQQ